MSEEMSAFAAYKSVEKKIIVEEPKKKKNRNRKNRNKVNIFICRLITLTNLHLRKKSSGFK